MTWRTSSCVRMDGRCGRARRQARRAPGAAPPDPGTAGQPAPGGGARRRHVLPPPDGCAKPQPQQHPTGWGAGWCGSGRSVGPTARTLLRYGSHRGAGEWQAHLVAACGGMQARSPLDAADSGVIDCGRESAGARPALAVPPLSPSRPETAPCRTMQPPGWFGGSRRSSLVGVSGGSGLNNSWTAAHCTSLLTITCVLQITASRATLHVSSVAGKDVVS